MQNLDPQLLQQLLAQLAQIQGGARDSNGTIQWGGPDGAPLDDWVIQNYARGTQIGSGNQSDFRYDPNNTFTTFSRPVADSAGKLIDVFDQNGKWLSREAGTDSVRELNTAIALMAAGYFGGGALGEAAGAAGTTGGMTASQQAAMMAANGMTDAEIAAALGTQGANAAGLTGVTGGAAGAGAGTVATSGLTAEQLASGAKTAYDAMGGGQGVATLLGAAAGAADGGDKTQSSSRDPWAPMQPYLKALAQEGADLYGKYKAQPFSQAQQNAYGNIGGLLDLVNANAGGLLSGFQANADGRNQFKRGQQNTLIGSSFNPTAAQWQPGLLGNFGTKG